MEPRGFCSRIEPVEYIHGIHGIKQGKILFSILLPFTKPSALFCLLLVAMETLIGIILYYTKIILYWYVPQYLDLFNEVFA